MDFEEVYKLAKHITPEPLTPYEFAWAADIPKSEVERMMVDDMLDMVATYKGDRIPFSALEKFVAIQAQMKIEDARHYFRYIAAALHTGMIAYNGLEDDGSPIYEEVCGPADDA